jgi:hypothetical protein
MCTVPAGPTVTAMALVAGISAKAASAAAHRVQHGVKVEPTAWIAAALSCCVNSIRKHVFLLS